MMTKRTLAVIAVVAVVVLGALASMAQTTRPGDTLQLWEYRTAITRERAVADTRADGRREGGSADAMLNTQGQEGWELVAVTRREIRVDDMLQTEMSYTFKRPTRTVNR
jgi:Domain of unknown function (DUF4177)